MSNPIRVLVIDDHAVVRNGLMLMVQHEPDMIPVAEASSSLRQEMYSSQSWSKAE